MLIVLLVSCLNLVVYGLLAVCCVLLDVCLLLLVVILLWCIFTLCLLCFVDCLGLNLLVGCIVDGLFCDLGYFCGYVVICCFVAYLWLFS